jgi:hypothetical protein
MTRRLSLTYRSVGYLSPVAERVAAIVRASGEQLMLH